MEQFIIQGNKPLKGEIKVRGAKNVVFPLLAATLLTDKPCIVKNLPLIEDVFRMLEILKSLGAKVSWEEERRVRICCQEIDLSKVNKEIVSTLRGSILLHGALLARIGKISLPQPGGCVIGARLIDTHLDVFSQFGVKMIQEDNFLTMEKTEKIKSSEILLQEFSPTATCNALLFASLLPQTTMIKTADQDYQVQELLKVLLKMGVCVKKCGHHEITIEGKKRLKGFEHTIIADPIEAGTFIILAATLKGNVLVKNTPLDFLGLFLKKLKTAGLSFKINLQEQWIEVLPWQTLQLTKMQALPYPGLQADLLSSIAVLATQTEGSTLIHDPIYEGRFKYLEEINRIGAKIFSADPHRVLVQGPTPLFGKKLGSIDLRGGAALIIAALVAHGTSTIDNIYQIDRGYEKIEKRLQEIGADIKRIKI